MDIKKITFNNYRSIKDIDLEFNHNLITLIGKNEGGKSNLLKGIALLNKASDIANEDLREPLSDEEEIDSSFVRFVFKLNKVELEQIYKNVNSQIKGFKDNQIWFIDSGLDISYNLKEYLELNVDGLFQIDVDETRRYATYWVLPEHFKTSNEYYFDSETKKVLFKRSSIAKLKDTVVLATRKQLFGLIGKEIISVVNKTLPDVIVWEYDSNNILPTSVDIEMFKNNPEGVLPLKNIFNLAGIKDISKKISSVQKGSGNKFTNLLNRVSKKATEHFTKVWKSYDNIQITLSKNGDDIDCNIEEDNKFSISQRSDGFKRFFSFLLNISARHKNDELNNVILIVDEPDLGLHPSAVRDLRDELINLSSKNKIIVATHSIFMIDADNIDRHRIVSKENEKTEISTPEAHNVADEEIIYRALGYSIYENFNAKNIIFEGWWDKKLFQVATSEAKHGYKTVFNTLSSIGICHCNGVKQIKNVTPVFDLANRKCIIVSDNDQPAKQHQKEYKKQNGYGEWYTYQNIYKDCNAMSGEDFIKDVYLKTHVAKTKENNNGLKGNPKYGDSKGIIQSLESWIKECDITDNDEIKKLVNGFKKDVFDNLKQENIKDSYFKFLKSLVEKV